MADERRLSAEELEGEGAKMCPFLPVGIGKNLLSGAPIVQPMPCMGDKCALWTPCQVLPPLLLKRLNDNPFSC